MLGSSVVHWGGEVRRIIASEERGQTDSETHLDLVLWERVFQVVQGQKGVIEVQGVEGARHPGGNRRKSSNSLSHGTTRTRVSPVVVCSSWVPIPEEDVMKPVWHHALCIHQVPYGL